jgi:hypothetical protein
VRRAPLLDRRKALTLGRRSVRPAAEWRPVADGPDVPERIAEAALAVRPPWPLVVFDLGAEAGARGDRARHQAIWILDAQLDPRS